MAERKGIQLAYPFEEKRCIKWGYPILNQPKLDGERCRILNMGDRCLLLSSSEEVIASVPHINQAVMSQLPIGEYDSELYVHGWTWEQIHSVVSRTRNIHPDHGKMQLHIFDLITENVQWERTAALNKLSPTFDLPLVHVPHEIAFDFEQLMNQYRHWLDLGYEGFICRHIQSIYIRKRSTCMMKFKPKKSDSYKIIGYKEELSKDGHLKGRLGAFVCIGNDGTEFSVGSGFTHLQRLGYWQHREELIGKMIKVEYQHITSGKRVPRFPIFCKVEE